MPISLRFTDLAKTFVTETREILALRGVSGEIAAGKITGLISPGGSGKTTLIRILAGLLKADRGSIEEVIDGNAGETGRARKARISYMPQRFGLYEDLTVAENLALYGDLHGLDATTREKRFAELHRFTGLEPFAKRLAGHLSGGMKQKLGLACTLVVAPDILLLDGPSVGVDPLSRRELWAMVRQLKDTGIAVLWSTGYLDEAERCDHVILLHEGRVLNQGPPSNLTARVRDRTWRIPLPENANVRKRDIQRAAAELEGVVDAQIQGRSLRVVMDEKNQPPPIAKSAFDALRALTPVPVTPQFEDAYLIILAEHAHETSPHAPPENENVETGFVSAQRPVVIEARDLTRRFGNFTAVDRVSFSVQQGEIFGLLGPNGAGKSTTFKMLCGLLPASGGEALVAGYDLGSARADARSRIGYMAQKYAYLGHLTVLQNMQFAAGVYGSSGKDLSARVDEAVHTYGLGPYVNQPCDDLPLGIKQRMALACAVMHRPAILFLDEPTSGVDPVTRREFWARINAMADDGVTVLVTSHFLDEAEYCDRAVIIYRGKIIASGTPDDIKKLHSNGGTLEDAFISLIEKYDLGDGTTVHAA